MTKLSSSKLEQSQSARQATSTEGLPSPEGETACLAVSSTKPVSTQVKTRSPRRKFSTEFKLKFLADYEACANALARGELLRKEGLYHSRITAWRQQRDQGKLGKQVQNKTSNKMRQLARENAALKKKLAQAEAVIGLKKKVSELFGQHILEPDSSEETP